MLPKVRWIASFSLILIHLLLPGATLARQKTASVYNKDIHILSTVEEPTGKLILLNLSSQKALAAPAMQLRQDEHGNHMVIFDFIGLVWQAETRQIVPKSSPIRSVRIGQFQAQPPTLRIAITAKEQQALKQIAISCSKGILKIKLPTSQQTEADAGKHFLPQPASQKYTQGTSINQKPPPTAPDFLATIPPANSARVLSEASGSQITINKSTSPSISTPFTKGGLFLNLSEQENQISTDSRSGNQPIKTALQTNKPILNSSAAPETTFSPMPPQAPDFRNGKDAAPVGVATPPLSTAADPAISKTGDALQQIPAVDPLEWLFYQPSSPSKVVLNLKAASAYKTFRLSAPERIVIDIDGMAINGEPTAPNIEATNYLRAIRAGLPEPGVANKIRIVLDLAAPNITMTEAFDETNRLLTLNLIPPTAITSAKGMVIVVDAGHGGSDPGAQRGDIQEKEITLSIAAKLKKLLESKGARVVMTRNDDSFVSLADRVRITNEVKPDAFISVHINALETNQTIHGIETYYQTEQSKSLAESIHGNLVSQLEAPDRFVRKARFYVVNHTTVPAILAEVGFISNKDERDKLISSEYQVKVADSLSRGVMLYLANRDGSNEANQIASTLETGKVRSLPKISTLEKNRSNISN